MIKKILPVISACFILFICKIIIYREDFYFYPVSKEKDLLTNNLNNLNELFIDNLRILHINPIQINSFFEFPEWINSSNTTFPIIPKTLSNKIIIFCQGNSQNITYKQYLLNQLCKNLNCSIFALDYLRIPNVNIENIITKSSKFINYINKLGIKNENIILFGESIGCSIALQLAIKNNINNVICLVPFRSMADQISFLLPFFGNIIHKFVNELNNYDIISKNNLNVTLLSTPNDEIIPFDQIKKMAIECNCELLEIKGTHGKTIIDKKIYNKLIDKYHIY
jgi:hypothetical protein